MIFLLPYHLSIIEGFVFSTEYKSYDTLDDRVEELPIKNPYDNKFTKNIRPMEYGYLAYIY